MLPILVCELVAGSWSRCIGRPPSGRPPGGWWPICSVRPAVTFPAAEHHRPLAGPSYRPTTWWQRHIGVNHLPKVVKQLFSRVEYEPTIASPTLYLSRHHATHRYTTLWIFDTFLINMSSGAVFYAILLYKQIQLDDTSATSTRTVVQAVWRTTDNANDTGGYPFTSYRYPRLFPPIVRRISLPHHQKTTHTVCFRNYLHKH